MHNVLHPSLGISGLRLLLEDADGDPLKAVRCAVRRAREAWKAERAEEARWWGRSGLRAARLAKQVSNDTQMMARDVQTLRSLDYGSLYKVTSHK